VATPTSLPKTTSTPSAWSSRLLSYLPSNNTEDPPHDLSVPIEEMEDPGINDCIPDSPSEPLDMYAVIRRLVDNGELLEVHAGFARNIIVGFARISGVVVGLVANQPMVMAGALDLNAADKVARFVAPATSSTCRS
jgi:acetyl-CoA carboxylase carboxyltransferase component